MRIKVYNKNIISLSYNTQKELTLTMCRPQEYYECDSNKLRNKVFTFEKFLDHYLDDKGILSYFDYWSGFNIPGHILENFFAKFDLSEREKKLFNVTRRFGNEPYYLIATKVNDTSTLKHELLHAHYYLNHGYKQKVHTVIRHMNPVLRKNITTRLKELGYTSSVITDEINAYMATSSLKYLTEDMDLHLSRKDIKPFVELAKTVL
jgi:hypothetical protein